jgi:hypothetical protein
MTLLWASLWSADWKSSPKTGRGVLVDDAGSEIRGNCKPHVVQMMQKMACTTLSESEKREIMRQTDDEKC